MPSLLSLPREIRDEIYSYVLMSPSGLIAPYFEPRTTSLKLHRRRLNSKTTRIHLTNSPLEFTPHDSIPTSQAVFRSRWRGTSISLSLPSTCRQIYDETRGLFWSKNTFFFDGFYEGGRELGVLRTLKVMGQTASRLIERVTIRMTSLCAEYTALRKVLKTLSSRARLGNFRKLELVWGEEGFQDMMYGSFGDERETGMFDRMLEDLRVGIEGERFERVVRVPGRPADEAERDLYEDVVRGIHLAVGGTMVCGGLVRWENYVMVGDCNKRCEI